MQATHRLLVPGCEWVGATSPLFDVTGMLWGDIFLIPLTITSLGSVIYNARDTQIQFRGSTCGICGGQSGTGQVPFQVLRFYPVNYHFINVS